MHRLLPSAAKTKQNETKQNKTKQKTPLMLAFSWRLLYIQLCLIIQVFVLELISNHIDVRNALWAELKLLYWNFSSKYLSSAYCSRLLYSCKDSCSEVPWKQKLKFVGNSELLKRLSLRPGVGQNIASSTGRHTYLCALWGNLTSFFFPPDSLET